MPAEIQTHLWCADYDAVFEVAGSKPGTSYTVTWYGTQAHCANAQTGEPCPGFRHRGQCRHIDVTFKQGCFYNTQWYDGGTRELRPTEHHAFRIITEDRCPKCDGPMIPMRAAV